MNQINNLIKSKEFIILISIIIVDLVTKLTANFFLPLEEKVCLIGEKVCFYLVYNDKAGNLFGGKSQSEGLLYAFIYVVLLCYTLFIRKLRIRTSYKILIGIGIFVMLVVRLKLIQPLFEGITISFWTVSVIQMLSALAFWSTLLYFCGNKWIRLFLIIYIAGGIGNLLSFFYNPPGAIDFINSRIGSFNIADVAINVGIIGLIVTLLFYGLKQVKKANKRTVIFKVAVIFSVLLFFCILLIFYTKPEKTRKDGMSRELNHQYVDSIQVTIDNRVYNYSFDSIKGINKLDSVKARELVLSIDSLIFTRIDMRTWKGGLYTVTIDSTKVENSKDNSLYAIYGIKCSVNIPASSQ